MKVLTCYEEKLAETVSDWGEDAVLIFRGQANCAWGLDSSADRRLRDQADSPGLVEYLTKSLIEPARLEGYAHGRDREQNDLELLASLQHQGAATCLIDFTANFHVALWFACDDANIDGKVFVINRGDVRTLKEVTPERASQGVTELLRRPQTHEETTSMDWQAELFFWKPPANENRILVQHSCFVFSAHPIQADLYKTVVISKKHKKEARNILRKFYGLEEESIFRDFTGFAASQSQGRPFNVKTSTHWFLEGNEHFQRGNKEQAIESYTKAIDLDSNFNSAYNNRGLANANLGRLEQAISDYGKAILINPEYVRAYNNRGNAYLRLGRYEDAIGDFSMAMEINSELAEPYFNRAIAEADRGQNEEAIRDLGKAISIDPKNAAAYFQRASVRHRLGRRKEAIADYDQAIRIKPDYARAFNNRGTACAELGQFERALSDFNAAIGIDPEEATFFLNRGRAKTKLQQYASAREDLNRALILAQGKNATELIRQIRQELDDLSSKTADK